MKKILCSALLALGVTVLVGATPAKAQLSDDAIVKVPFRFIVDNTVLPAGTYRVLIDATSPSVVKIYQEDGTGAALVTTEWGGPTYDKAHPRFNFKKYGDNYFLSEVLLPDESPREVPLFASDVEHELARLASMRYATEHKG
jgi:hypothetical protein